MSSYQESDLPALDAYESAKLGLEISALEKGITPEAELRRRAELMGNRLVSYGQPKPNIIVRGILRAVEITRRAKGKSNG